jgi:phosphoglycerate dehydrogenase-like enzyme
VTASFHAEAGLRQHRLLPRVHRAGRLGKAAGDWRSGAGTGLCGRTIGVVGASQTGRRVLERLRALEVRLLLAANDGADLHRIA